MEQIEKNEYSTFFVEKIIPILKKETRVSNRYSPWFYGKPSDKKPPIALKCEMNISLNIPVYEILVDSDFPLGFEDILNEIRTESQIFVLDVNSKMELFWADN